MFKSKKNNFASYRVTTFLFELVDQVKTKYNEIVESQILKKYLLQYISIFLDYRDIPNYIPSDIYFNFSYSRIHKSKTNLKNPQRKIGRKYLFFIIMNKSMISFQCLANQ